MADSGASSLGRIDDGACRGWRRADEAIHTACAPWKPQGSKGEDQLDSAASTTTRMAYAASRRGCCTCGLPLHFPTASAGHLVETTTYCSQCPWRPHVRAILPGDARWQHGGCRTSSPTQHTPDYLPYIECHASVITINMGLSSSHITHPKESLRIERASNNVLGYIKPTKDHANHLPLFVVTQTPGPTTAYHTILTVHGVEVVKACG